MIKEKLTLSRILTQRERDLVIKSGLIPNMETILVKKLTDSHYEIIAKLLIIEDIPLSRKIFVIKNYFWARASTRGFRDVVKF